MRCGGRRDVSRGEHDGLALDGALADDRPLYPDGAAVLARAAVMDAATFYDLVAVGIHVIVFFMGFQAGMHR